MQEVRIEKCQYCGGEEFIECHVDSPNGRVYVSAGVFRNTALSAIVCRNCGSVVRAYCQKPEKLYPKKEGRE